MSFLSAPLAPPQLSYPFYISPFSSTSNASMTRFFALCGYSAKNGCSVLSETVLCWVLEPSLFLLWWLLLCPCRARSGAKTNTMGLRLKPFLFNLPSCVSRSHHTLPVKVHWHWLLRVVHEVYLIFSVTDTNLLYYDTVQYDVVK